MKTIWNAGNILIQNRDTIVKIANVKVYPLVELAISSIIPVASILSRKTIRPRLKCAGSVIFIKYYFQSGQMIKINYPSQWIDNE